MRTRGATPLSVASLVFLTTLIVTLQFALANWSQLGIGHLYFAPILVAAILIGPRTALLVAVAAVGANALWYAVTPGVVSFGAESVALCIRGSAYLGVAVASGYYAAREDRLRNELSRMAMTDALTGLYNRHAFRSALDRSIIAERPFALLAADVDSLKKVNDSQGHTAGDARIVQLAEALRRACGPDAPIARVGGDEFLAITPGGEPDPDGLDQVTALGAVGIAQFPDEAATASDLIELADRRLYADKHRAHSTSLAPQRAARAQAA